MVVEFDMPYCVEFDWLLAAEVMVVVLVIDLLSALVGPTVVRGLVMFEAFCGCVPCWPRTPFEDE
jgi:hypothetical protein